MFDCAIVGTGAAGVSAALTLKSLNKNFVWLGDENLSGKICRAEKIRNYPGLNNVDGEGMRTAFLQQIRDMSIAITPARINGIYQMGDYFSLLSDKTEYDAKTVILAIGVEAVKPAEGELEFVGRGVSYCATCDGFLYKGKTIAVVCTAKQFEHEIEYLASLAGKVYLVPLYKGVQVNAKNVEIVSGLLTKINGTMRVQSVTIGDRQLEVDGVFMLKSAVVPSVLVAGLNTKDGHVVVERDMSTNLKGLFAAGDCTGRPYQYAKAVGEGNVAAHSVVEFLGQS
jgi:thioredoxin reductase (NADPH)